MAFQLSPGVLVTEKDLTSVVPQVATTAGAFAGDFQWGPVDQVVTVNSENDLMAHYSWASLSVKYPTLEIRVHGATLNAWKVKGWIDVVTQLRPAIMAAMTNSESWNCYKHITSIFDILDSNSIGYKYMLARRRANGSLTSFGFSR